MNKKKVFDLSEFRSTELPTEAEIISSWKSENEKPVISILCHTYNHRSYIEDALRGFLIQKTKLPFEVIVHDDASTDGTSEIVKRYAKEYPRIINPIIQSENQYARGRKPTLLSFPHAKGEFIAICEGDDFWISRNKLEKQSELMRLKADVDIFFHPAVLFVDEEVINLRNYYGEHDEILSLKTVIREGGGVMPTASILVRRAIFDDLPSWFKNVPLGDYYIQVLAATNGAYYCPGLYSAYRLGTQYSVSKAHNQQKGEQLKSFFEAQMAGLEGLKDSLDEKYATDILYYQSLVSQNCAVQCLSFKDFNGFYAYIEFSWNYYRKRAKSQYMLRLMRRTPRVARMLIVIRNLMSGVGSRGVKFCTRLSVMTFRK
ncbi:glycosyltransferase [Marinobacter salarius]|uniref:glycosyltransferase family 2 protein n=1 Tax=Marinobacter salarius TaxID=1420917 RepID=UPI001D184757|nr:glycosyltransferase [Marinobacter salarius]MCC4282809.1 glycosyltransferase [Marinobacter salarius]